MIFASNYIFMDWGDAFRSMHADEFAELHNPGFNAEMGPLSVRLLLDNRGAGYMPERSGAQPPRRWHADTGYRRRQCSPYPAFVAYQDRRRRVSVVAACSCLAPGAGQEHGQSGHVAGLGAALGCTQIEIDARDIHDLEGRRCQPDPVLRLIDCRQESFEQLVFRDAPLPVVDHVACRELDPIVICNHGDERLDACILQRVALPRAAPGVFTAPCKVTAHFLQHVLEN